MSKFLKKYNNILLEYSEDLLEFNNITLAIVPGSFKPPHKGHLEMIIEYATFVDKVLIIISNVSKATNANRILSKSALLSLSKILNSYTIQNIEAQKIISNIQNNADNLTYNIINDSMHELAKYIDNNSDMYKEIQIYLNNLEKNLNKSLRLTSNKTEITPEISKQIFELYIKKYNLTDKVIVIIGDKPSPMSSAVSIINDHCKNCKIVLGVSNKNNDSSRWASFIKSFNTENNNEFIEKSFDVQTNISATYIRNNINNLEKEWFPDRLSNEDFIYINHLLK